MAENDTERTPDEVWERVWGRRPPVTISHPPSRRHRAPEAAGLFDELVVDNFAGGGGASLGIERATGRAVDIAINHDWEAIQMHAEE